ncbi:MAG: DnaJ C-terminal domain-containing protein [Betaproteobacteria bacterium]
MEFKDYYQTLGVAREATADEIKKAYRRLARKYHPDVSKEANAEACMKEVNEANAVLSDPEKRAAYDQVGQGLHAGQEFRPPPDWDAGFEFSGRGPSGARGADFSDFFAELFGRQQGGGGRGAHFDARGEDRHAKIAIDLEDGYQGATRLVTLRTPDLDGEGRVTMKEHSLNVRIPKGVHEGQVLRLAAKGSPGLGAGPPGDLYLEIHFNAHRRFRVEGRDVYATLRVAPWEAALGATVKVALPVGAVEVRVPESSQTGRKLRLRERGIPGTPPGDLYLMLEVVLPPADSAKAREVYETMAKDLAFNPRESES